MIFQTQPSTGSRSAQRQKAAWLYLVVFAGVSQQVPEEVEAGALAHHDEVGGAVGQVGGGREAFGAAGASAAHAGRVDGQELPPDCPPLAVALYKGETHTHTPGISSHVFCHCPLLAEGSAAVAGGGARSPPSDASSASYRSAVSGRSCPL